MDFFSYKFCSSLKAAKMLCLRPHHPELLQLSKKALLYLSCWQPPLLISVKEQPEITHLSGGVTRPQWLPAPSGCGPARRGEGGRLTGILGCLPPRGPAEVPLLWDQKELVYFPREALEQDGPGGSLRTLQQPLKLPPSEDHS